MDRDTFESVDAEREQARARAAEHRRRVAERDQARGAAGDIVWLDVPVTIGATGRLRIVGFDDVMTPAERIRTHVPTESAQEAAGGQSAPIAITTATEGRSHEPEPSH